MPYVVESVHLVWAWALVVRNERVWAAAEDHVLRRGSTDRLWPAVLSGASRAARGACDSGGAGEYDSDGAARIFAIGAADDSAAADDAAGVADDYHSGGDAAEPGAGSGHDYYTGDYCSGDWRVWRAAERFFAVSKQHNSGQYDPGQHDTGTAGAGGSWWQLSDGADAAADWFWHWQLWDGSELCSAERSV